MTDGNNDGTYKISFPVHEFREDLIEYKYRILTERPVILLKKGWEATPKRIVNPAGRNDAVCFNYFSDIKRCVRLIVDTKDFEKSGKFLSGNKDNLMINIKLDGKPKLTKQLKKVDKNKYEFAIQIKENVKKLEWEIKTGSSNRENGINSENIGLNGRAISIKIQ